jgi:hypothetical protein
MLNLVLIIFVANCPSLDLTVFCDTLFCTLLFRN